MKSTKPVEITTTNPARVMGRNRASTFETGSFVHSTPSSLKSSIIAGPSITARAMRWPPSMYHQKYCDSRILTLSEDASRRAHHSPTIDNPADVFIAAEYME